MVSKKIALIGCSGLLGSHIGYLLNKKKIKFTGFSRKKPTYIKKKNWIYFDLLKKLSQNAKKILIEADVLLVVAAYVPSLKKYDIKLANKCNINFIDHISDFSVKNRKKLIFISGVLTIRKNFDLYKKYSKDFNNIHYLKTKIKAERILMNKKLKKNLDLAIIRPTSIYGYGLKKEKLLNKIIEKKYTYTTNKNKIFFNFIHAFDIARLVYKLVKENRSGFFNIGNQSFDDIAIIKKIHKIKKLQVIKKIKKINFYNYNKSNLNKIGFKNIISFKSGLKLMINKKFA